MDQKEKTRRILRKIWYGTAITLSVLVLVFSTIGVIGTWIFEQTAVNVTQNLLSATAKTAGGLQVVAARIEQDSSELRADIQQCVRDQPEDQPKCGRPGPG